MKRIVKIFIGLLLIILGQTAFGMDEVNFDFFTIQDGLSQSSITCVYVDSDGLLWVGTQDGLNLYDGYSFKIFRSQPDDTNSISNNIIYSIVEDSDNYIWVGTQYGLSRYDKTRHIFKNFLIDQPSQDNEPFDNTVFSIYQTSDDKLWVKTMSSLYWYQPKEETFKKLELFNDSSGFVQGSNYFPIIEGDSGSLWVGTKDGLYYIDLKKVELTRYYYIKDDEKSISNNRIKSLCFDYNGNLWVGTQNGLNLFDPAKKEFRRYFPGNIPTINIGNEINFIKPYKKNKFFLGTGHGLAIFDPEGKPVFNPVVFSNNQRVYKNDYFSSLAIDGANILWIGTYRGLIKKDLKPLKFNLHNEVVNPFPGITSYDIGSIYVDSEDNLWLGTWGDGLNKIQPDGTVQNFTSQNRRIRNQIPDDRVHLIYEDTKGVIWIGTQDGIFLYRNKQFINPCREYPWISCTEFRHHRVYDIISKDLSYSIATNHGLIILDIENKLVKRYNSFVTDTSIINFNTVYCHEYDAEGDLWLGTDNGLLKLSSSLQVKAHYQHKRNQIKNLISGNNIYSMLITGKNEIWVGTGSGLNRFLPDENRFKVFSERNGLPNNLIYALEEDNEGDLWISTNRGLVQFKLEENKFYNYDLRDGIQNYEYNLGASFKSSDGKMYFGGISGLNTFYPDSVVLNSHIPNVKITSITKIEMGGIKILVPDENNMIFIGTESFVSIRFSSLDFTYPAKNHYKYQLINNGDEQPWVELGDKHEAIFSGLHSGAYELRILGSNNDQVWNETPTVLLMDVNAPFWESTYAFFIYIFLITLFLYIFYRYRTRALRRLNREYRERERINKQVARQKEELTIKNKNITDSINYAKRIQEAMMPSKELFKKYLADSFILHMPKDIVSGDFYWVHKKSNNKIFVAAVDCTGHGVPGAFMSIIGFELFRKITNIQGIEEPAEILNTLNDDFAEIFKDVNDITLRDGMDIAFCVIDKKKNLLEYAGAFNPLYLIRDNKISEIKGDRFSVGIELGEEGAPKKFQNHVISLEPDDMVYIFSDGFADQFGGPEGKKYKYRRFRHLLLTIHKLPLDLQHDLLQKSIIEWKEDLDQVDDILVLGFKPAFL